MSVYTIKKRTNLPGVLQETSLLTVDEATLLHWKVVEVVDRILREICIRSSTEKMLFCGVFYQIMPPVIRRG